MHRRLSFRVREELVARLQTGRIAPGSRLPPEPELAEELGVSRPTLREALRSLEEDGLVTRTRGTGTYATRRPRLRNNLDVNFGVTESIRAAGMAPGTVETSVHSEAATQPQAEALDIAVGDPMLVLERVRTADGRPVVFSRDVMSVATVSAAELMAMPLDGSLYHLFESHGRSVEYGIVRLEPSRADRPIAKKLGVKPGAQLFLLEQVDFSREGEPILLSEEYHLSDAFEFTVVRRGPGRGST